MCLLVHRAQDMEFSLTPVLDMKTMNEMKRRQCCLVWCAGVAFLRCLVVLFCVREMLVRGVVCPC